MLAGGRDESTGVFDAARHAIMACLVAADVGQFFAEIGQAFVPGNERLTDLGGQQPELERNVVDIEVLGQLVQPSLVLNGADIQFWLPWRTVQLNLGFTPV